MAGNNISNLTPLIYLDKLTDLDLYNNNISDISALAGLTGLYHLNLEGNNISDLTPLVENSGLGNGDEVWLINNNLDLTEGSEDMQNIKILQDRGVEVIY